MAGTPLPPHKIPLALARIAAWRSSPGDPISCPQCETAGLVVLDQSARPYAEWYALSCAACGLDATIHLPMAPRIPDGD